ncbi:MAG: hypothetical protein RL464_327 [Actinomycetota bacterium]
MRRAKVVFPDPAGPSMEILLVVKDFPGAPVSLCKISLSDGFFN